MFRCSLLGVQFLNVTHIASITTMLLPDDNECCEIVPTFKRGSNSKPLMLTLWHTDKWVTDRVLGLSHLVWPVLLMRPGLEGDSSRLLDRYSVTYTSRPCSLF